jgi:hypothetical protein
LKFALFPSQYVDLVNDQRGVDVGPSTAQQWSSQGSGTSPTPTGTLGMGFPSGVVKEFAYLSAINPPLSVFVFADYGTGTVCSFGGAGTGQGWAATMTNSGTGLRSRFTFGGVADYDLVADIPGTSFNGGVYDHVWTVDKNGGTFNAYLNGRSAGAGVAVGTMSAITQPFDVAIGRNGSGSFFNNFTKAIGTVLVWNRVISPVEIAMLHANPYQLLAPNQRVLYGVGVTGGVGGGGASVGHRQTNVPIQILKVGSPTARVAEVVEEAVYVGSPTFRTAEVVEEAVYVGNPLLRCTEVVVEVVMPFVPLPSGQLYQFILPGG